MGQAMTLRGLIQAVSEGRYEPDMFCPMFHAQGLCTECEGAFAGSLDAAKRLHDALLPGWAMFVGNTDGEPGPFTAAVRNPADETIAQAENADPARAWLLAVLRALEGEP